MKLALVSVKQMGVEFPTSTPLGLVSIATYVKEKGGFSDIKIIDLNFDDKDAVLGYTPDLIGISAMTVDYSRAIELAAYFKQTLDVPLVLGGVHISTLPSSLDENFNLGVLGEGEQTALELIQLFDEKEELNPKDLAKINGLVYWGSDGLETTAARSFIENLDEIPIPDKSLLHPKYFEPRILFYQNRVVPQGHLMTSRGCPYKCVFCSTSKFWCSRVRYHSAGHVVEEVKGLHDDYGVKHIHVEDDLFTINLKRLREIKDGLTNEGLLDKVTFSCQPRANLVNEETCQLLKDLNVKTVGFGFESGCEKTLNYLKGGSVTVEQNKQAVKMCVKYGFNVNGSLIFGSPGESISDMQQTLDFYDFLIDNGATNVWSFVMTPFPGTEIWEEAKRRGKVSDDMDFSKLSHYNLKEPLMLDEHISINEFEKILELANKKAFKLGNRDQWKELIKLRIKRNPLGVLKLALANPKRAVKYLFKGS